MRLGYPYAQCQIVYFASPTPTHLTGKDPITLIVCSNISGTDKKRLLVKGKSKQPRCFKNVKCLPVDYEANCNAWMTSEILENWLRSQDKQLYLQCRKVRLLIDKLPRPSQCQSPDQHQTWISPTVHHTIIQPMDQGLTNNIKGFYCQKRWI